MQSIADHVAELLKLLLVVSHKSRLQRLAHHDASILQGKRSKAWRNIRLAKHRRLRHSTFLLQNRRHGSNLLYNLNLELLLLLLAVVLVLLFFLFRLLDFHLYLLLESDRYGCNLITACSHVFLRMFYGTTEKYSVDNQCAIHTPWSEATAKYNDVHNDDIFTSVRDNELYLKAL